MSDPMEPVQKLMEQFIKVIEPLGLAVHTFALLPNPGGPPHAVQVMLTFDEAAAVPVATSTSGVEGVDGPVELSPEERDVFELLERDLTRSTQEEKAEEAAEGLQKLLRDLEGGNDKGILGDDA